MISSTSQLTELSTIIEEFVQIKEHVDNKVAINSQDYILLVFIFLDACLCANFLLKFVQLQSEIFVFHASNLINAL